MKHIFLLIFIIISDVNCIEINTKSGKIAGIITEVGNLKFYSFLGIPYAKPPLRFQAPQAIESWNGTLNATKEKSKCPQVANNPLDSGNEDCLYLNVYTPYINTTETKWPVMFWIHGGEFSYGSGHYNSFGPELFIKQNITVVTVNFRLGPFGFLCTHTKDISCNSGLKDTAVALKWVKENIEAFNGDNNNICIGGESSGGVIVHYLLMSPMTKNLINKAFISSGSATGYRFFNYDCPKSAIMLSKIMGFNSNNITEVVAFLKESKTEDIIKAMDVIKNSGKQGATVHQPFVPCAEKYDEENTFLTNLPIKFIRKGKVKNVPIMTGFNTDEGMKMLPILYKNFTLLEEIDNDFQRVIPSDLNLEDDTQEKIDLSNKIKQYYFGDKHLNNETINNYLDLIGDSMFRHSIDYWIRIISKFPKRKPIYYYEFSFNGELNQFKIKNKLDYPGTSHGDDIGYYWITDETRQIKMDQKNISSFKMRDIFIKLLANFMKTGNPTPKTTTSLNTLWNPVSWKKQNYFLFTNNLTMNSSPYAERMWFWREIYSYH